METTKREPLRERGKFQGPGQKSYVLPCLKDTSIHNPVAPDPSGKFSVQLWLYLEAGRDQILSSRKPFWGPYFMLGTVPTAGDSEINTIDMLSVPVEATDRE